MNTYDLFLSQFTDYRSKTTFWDDFSIAEQYEDVEPGAIERTYKSAMKHWKRDYEYLTELVLVLNHKMWMWAEKNERMGKLYEHFWNEARQYAETHLKDDELKYYYRVTD